MAFKKIASGWVLVDPNEDTGFIQYRDNGSSTKYVLKESSSYLYVMDPMQEWIYLFSGKDHFSPIARILDRRGNQLIYTGGSFPTRIALRWRAAQNRLEDLTHYYFSTTR